ncbi:hypothetical protein HID58_011481 [Brassica napus]|uniref:Uncharacterized protein n=1 Tax=Brassica napus TaxID=3708 RepID=A0ABQ8DYH1_BRANA|nr:hypothetical protein HID58_011481 [Brassica napus]
MRVRLWEGVSDIVVETFDIVQAHSQAVDSARSVSKVTVQMAVQDIRESASTRTTTLHSMRCQRCKIQLLPLKPRELHMVKTESNYHQDTSAVESGKKTMQEVLLNCLEKAESAHQWRKAQESLVSLERNNVASVDSIVRVGMDANENLRSHLLTSIDNPLKLNNDACAKINSMIIPCYEDLIELKSDHNHKIVEITDNTGKCLLDEYIVDEPSSSEELLRAFQDGKLFKQANGDAKQQQQHLIRASSLYEAAVSDSRSPLSAVN